MINTDKQRIRDLEEAISNAIYIMDEKGRSNEDESCYMLWRDHWNDMRYTLLKAKDPTIEDDVMRA